METIIRAQYSILYDVSVTCDCRRDERTKEEEWGKQMGDSEERKEEGETGVAAPPSG